MVILFHALFRARFAGPIPRPLELLIRCDTSRLSSFLLSGADAAPAAHSWPCSIIRHESSFATTGCSSPGMLGNATLSKHTLTSMYALLELFTCSDCALDVLCTITLQSTVRHGNCAGKAPRSSGLAAPPTVQRAEAWRRRAHLKRTPSHITACVGHRRAYQRRRANVDALPRSFRLHAPTLYHQRVGAYSCSAALIRQSSPTPTKPCSLLLLRSITPRSSIIYALNTSSSSARSRRRFDQSLSCPIVLYVSFLNCP